MYTVKVASSGYVPDDNWFLMSSTAVSQVVHGAGGAAPKFRYVNQIFRVSRRFSDSLAEASAGSRTVDVERACAFLRSLVLYSIR